MNKATRQLLWRTSEADSYGILIYYT